MSLSCRFELFGLVDLLVDSDFCKFAIPAKYCSWNTDSWNFFATGWYFTHASHWLPSDVTIPHSLCRTLRQKITRLHKYFFDYFYQIYELTVLANLSSKASLLLSLSWKTAGPLCEIILQIGSRPVMPGQSLNEVTDVKNSSAHSDVTFTGRPLL